MEYEPISRAGFEATRTWLQETIAHNHNSRDPKPDDRLLLEGIPQGCIQGVTEDIGIQLLRTDTKTSKELRSPRYFDPAGLAVVRLMLMGGGSLRFNPRGEGARLKHYIVLSGHVDKKDRQSQKYLDALKETRINTSDKDLDKVTMLRIIADAPAYHSTHWLSNDPEAHYSYRRRDIAPPSSKPTEGKASGRQPAKGRQEAIDLAHFRFLYNKEKLGFNISLSEYKELLEQAFDLLNQIPLGRPL